MAELRWNANNNNSNHKQNVPNFFLPLKLVICLAVGVSTISISSINKKYDNKNNNNNNNTPINNAIIRNDGIDIPIIAASSACSRDRNPQNVSLNADYGAIIASPWPTDQLANRAPTIDCRWFIEVNVSQAIKVIVLRLELSTPLQIDLFEIHNFNASNATNQNNLVRIASFTGNRNRKLRPPVLQTGTNRLLIRYRGSAASIWSSSFAIYVERLLSAPIERCANRTDIRCRDATKCVARERACDTIDDCADGTDEENCDYSDHHHHQRHQNGHVFRRNSSTFSSPCGMRPNRFRNRIRIVGGDASLPGSWPWMVSLRLVEREPYGHMCGGTILNRRWIMTAAHCFTAFPDRSAWTVHAGKYQKIVHDKSEIRRYIKRSVIHPQFGGRHLHNFSTATTFYDANVNDIALIELNAPLPDNRHLSTIGSICLPDDDDDDDRKKTSNISFDGSLGSVLGWGDAYQTGNEFVLKQAIVPIISNSRCREWMPEFDVGPRMICAGYEVGGQDSCQGDSGGPLLIANGDRFEQIGIISTGNEICALRKKAGIYTRVSSFTSWIRSIITSD